MSEDVRKKAEATLAEVQAISEVILPEPKGEIVPLEAADEPVSIEIRKRMDEFVVPPADRIVRKKRKSRRPH